MEQLGWGVLLLLLLLWLLMGLLLELAGGGAGGVRRWKIGGGVLHLDINVFVGVFEARIYSCRLNLVWLVSLLRMVLWLLVLERVVLLVERVVLVEKVVLLLEMGWRRMTQRVLSAGLLLRGRS